MLGIHLRPQLPWIISNSVNATFCILSISALQKVQGNSSLLSRLILTGLIIAGMHHTLVHVTGIT